MLGAGFKLGRVTIMITNLRFAQQQNIFARTGIFLYFCTNLGLLRPYGSSKPHK